MAIVACISSRTHCIEYPVQDDRLGAGVKGLEVHSILHQMTNSEVRMSVGYYFPYI